MVEIFFPDAYLDKVQDIDLDMLKKKNIKGLILDIDNTLVPSHVSEADDKAFQWIERLKENGFEICIVSNATKKRVEKFNEKLKVYAIHRAVKPFLGAYKRAMVLMGTKPEETAVVGDQIFTDIYGGNRLGMLTILVKPLHKKEFFFVKLKRWPEKYILKKYHDYRMRSAKLYKY
ncbi:MAG TPA: YqeG family HAD IIIA-type phosphatase [Clostridiaceae bacterium]|nr:YqeG family HAD IIIA-type phosphatase [Clostridiaceae bacterium]